MAVWRRSAATCGMQSGFLIRRFRAERTGLYCQTVGRHHNVTHAVASVQVRKGAANVFRGINTAQLTSRCRRAAIIGSSARSSWPSADGNVVLAFATASSNWLMRTEVAARAADAALADAIAAATSACISNNCRGTAFWCTLIAFSS